MVTAISVSISGGNQSASGTKPKADAISEIECADGERGDDDDERPQPPERDHQAEQEQEVIGAFEDVPEAGHDEAQCGVVPARIEAHEAGIAVEFECANGACGRQEAQRRGDFAAQAGRRAGGSRIRERSDRIGYSSSTSSSCWFQ